MQDTKTAQKQLVSLITEHLSDSIPVTRILTYKPSKNGAVTGRFESQGRVYNFVFNGADARYKPAMNADSALFSDYYLERFDAAVAPIKGVRALPKCTSKSYSCKGNVGVRCLPLTQHCKMGSSAIGNERLGKIKKLSSDLADAVMFDIEPDPKNQKNLADFQKSLASIVEKRMALAVENRAKREPKKNSTIAENSVDDQKYEELKKPPQKKESIGKGASGEVYETPNGTAYKSAFGHISEEEVSITSDAARIGTAPKLIGVYSNNGEIKGFEMEYLKDYKTLNAVPKELTDKAVESFNKSLAELHKNGIIHGDLHEENILIGKNGEAKVIDFGLSSRIPNESKDSDIQFWAHDVGELSYLSSEVMKSSGGKYTKLYTDTSEKIDQIKNKSGKIKSKKAREAYYSSEMRALYQNFKELL